MSQILSHPFRLTASGDVATVEQNSDEANAEQIAVLILTRKGERLLAPSFGLTDPTYAGIEPTEVMAGVVEHGPDVTVTDVDLTAVSDSTQSVTVTFE